MSRSFFIDHPEGDGWLGLTIYECDSAYNISSQQRWTIYINEIRRIPEVIISLSDRSSFLAPT